MGVAAEPPSLYVLRPGSATTSWPARHRSRTRDQRRARDRPTPIGRSTRSAPNPSREEDTRGAACKSGLCTSYFLPIVLRASGRDSAGATAPLSAWPAF